MTNLVDILRNYREDVIAIEVQKDESLEQKREEQERLLDIYVAVIKNRLIGDV